MHCTCCNAFLSDFEATRKNAITFEFVDLCNACYNEVKHAIPAIERKDLITEDDYDELDTLAPEYTYEDLEDIKDFINKFSEDT